MKKVLKAPFFAVVLWYPAIGILNVVLKPLVGNADGTFITANAAYIVLEIALLGGLILDKLQQIQDSQKGRVMPAEQQSDEDKTGPESKA